MCLKLALFRALPLLSRTGTDIEEVENNGLAEQMQTLTVPDL